MKILVAINIIQLPTCHGIPKIPVTVSHQVSSGTVFSITSCVFLRPVGRGGAMGASAPLHGLWRSTYCGPKVQKKVK